MSGDTPAKWIAEARDEARGFKGYVVVAADLLRNLADALEAALTEIRQRRDAQVALELARNDAYDRGWGDATESAAEKMDKLNPWAAGDLRDQA